MSFGDMRLGFEEGPEVSFVGRNGTQFVLDGKPFYINGWNSYWLMVQSVDDYSRPRVREMLRAGPRWDSLSAELGLSMMVTTMPFKLHLVSSMSKLSGLWITL
ncbi:Mannan endo-1,4-beta-mannosidase [Arachis hypogaea]|nr:Mannan endo-1,4-beta-mannosidase [Arachis hypogaea]